MRMSGCRAFSFSLTIVRSNRKALEKRAAKAVGATRLGSCTGAPETSIATTMSASDSKRSNGRRVRQTAVDERASLMDDGLENHRQRHARGNRGPHKPFGENFRLLIVEVRGDDHQRNLTIREVSLHVLGQDEVENGSGIENGVSRAENAHEPLERLRRRNEEIADEAEPLRKDVSRVLAKIASRNPRRIRGAINRTDRRSRDDARLQTELVEGFEHEDVGKTARASAAERKSDASAFRAGSLPFVGGISDVCPAIRRRYPIVSVMSSRAPKPASRYPCDRSRQASRSWRPPHRRHRAPLSPSCRDP